MSICIIIRTLKLQEYTPSRFCPDLQQNSTWSIFCLPSHSSNCLRTVQYEIVSSTIGLSRSVVRVQNLSVELPMSSTCSTVELQYFSALWSLSRSIGGVGQFITIRNECTCCSGICSKTRVNSIVHGYCICTASHEMLH